MHPNKTVATTFPDGFTAFTCSNPLFRLLFCLWSGVVRLYFIKKRLDVLTHRNQNLQASMSKRGIHLADIHIFDNFYAQWKPLS